MEPEVRRLPNDSAYNVFEVTLDGYVYQVKLTDSYYRKLTGGKTAQEDLVKESFKFMLEREGPESIIKEFELPLINDYFPDYEQTVSERLK
jgi:hypothetical protein